MCIDFFFFFQAEDGIRDGTVTGVQTCALPIFVAAGDGDVDVVGGGAVNRGDDQVVVHHLPGGERIGQRLVERVAPDPGGRVEGVGAIGPGQRGGRLAVVQAAVDVVHGERAGGG